MRTVPRAIQPLLALSFLALFLTGCYDVQVTVRIQGHVAQVHTKVVAPQYLAESLKSYFDSHQRGRTRNYLQDDRYVHEEWFRLALRSSKVKAGKEGWLVIRGNCLTCVASVGHTDEITAALSPLAFGKHYLTFVLDLPGRKLKRAAATSVGGLDIIPKVHGSAATWRIPLWLLVRSGQDVRFKVCLDRPVINLRPRALFNIVQRRAYRDPEAGLILATDDTAVFDASASRDPDGTISTCEWQFSDGLVLRGRTVRRCFSEPGRYHVTLTLLDAAGASGTKRESFLAYTAPDSLAPLIREMRSLVATAQNLLESSVRQPFLRLVEVARAFHRRARPQDTELVKSFAADAAGLFLELWLTDYVNSYLPGFTDKLGSAAQQHVPHAVDHLLQQLQQVPVIRKFGKSLAEGAMQTTAKELSESTVSSVAEGVAEQMSSCPAESFPYDTIREKHNKLMAVCTDSLNTAYHEALRWVCSVAPKDVRAWVRELRSRTVANTALASYFTGHITFIATMWDVHKQLNNKTARALWHVLFDAANISTYLCPTPWSPLVRGGLSAAHKAMDLAARMKDAEFNGAMWLLALNIVSDPGMTDLGTWDYSVPMSIFQNSLGALREIAAGKTPVSTTGWLDEVNFTPGRLTMLIYHGPANPHPSYVLVVRFSQKHKVPTFFFLRSARYDIPDFRLIPVRREHPEARASLVSIDLPQDVRSVDLSVLQQLGQDSYAAWVGNITGYGLKHLRSGSEQ